FYDDQQVRRFASASSCALVLARFTPISSSTAGMVALNVNNGGADGLVTVLRDLANASSRRELADVPLLFWGHSGGSRFGLGFARIHPDRTLAVVGYQGIAVDTTAIDAVSKIPVLVFADKDNTAIDGSSGIVWTMGRSRHAPWAFVPQRTAPHGDLSYLK